MPGAWTPSTRRWVGLAVAAAAAAASLRAATPRPPAWWPAAALFAGLWWWVNGPACAAMRPPHRLLTVSLLAAAALACATLQGTALGATYLVLVAAVAGSVLAERSALLLVALQSALLVPGLVWAGSSLGRSLTLAAIFAALQAFVLQTAFVAREEAAARRELEIAHLRLQEAQDRLEERSRDAERLRIARDLHDVLGHHLTALSLSLEAARHVEEQEREQQILDAQVLAKRLLRDVRALVSAIREPPDLARDLERLAAETKRPQIRLRWAIAPSRGPTEAGATAILQLAREAVTNSARHGQATSIDIQIDAADGGWRVTASDDGRPADGEVAPGFGLRGIDERFRELGGWARWGRAASGGFEIRAWLPEAAG